MTKEARAAALKALTECSCSGFTAADMKMLEAASDERIESFRAAADARKVEIEAKQTADAAAAATIKAAEEKAAAAEVALKAAQAQAIPAEELSELRSLAAAKKAQDAAHKAALVTVLKAAQSVYDEARLNEMPIVQLEEVVALTKASVPEVASYAGKAVPRAAEQASYEAPDGYAAALKTASDKSTATVQ